MKNWNLTRYYFFAFEKTGIIPRSIYRILKRLINQFEPFHEYEVLKNFRISKYQTLIFFRYIFLTLCIPFIFSNFLKKLFFIPIINNFWDYYNLRIFLNITQEKRAYEELQHYHNRVIFRNLLSTNKIISKKDYKIHFKIKTTQLAKKYRTESKKAIINIFTDLSSFFFFINLLIQNKRQFLLFKSFIEETFYGLSDTGKAFLIILFTDIFVGFHSSHGWEVFLEIILRHFGLPESRNFIFIFVATLPVILDAIFKYLIFRYLNKLSPSTVATYKTMNE